MKPATLLLSSVLFAATAMAQTNGATITVRQDLEVLRSPGFRERLVQSYLAESDVEPPLTAAERKTLQAAIDLVATERAADAVAALERSRGPAASAQLDFTLANTLTQLDRLDEAAAAAGLAVQKFPRFRRAWAHLGMVQFRRGDFREAGRALSRAVELGAHDALTYGLLGVAHARSQRYVAAESAFRMAAMLAPDEWDWQMGLAETFYRQERFADAVALFRGLQEQHPDRPELWLALGEAYLRLGKDLEAVKCLQVVDGLGAATPAMLANLADACARLGLPDLAAAAWLRGMEAEGGTADRALRGARFLLGRGAPEEAAELAAQIAARRGDRLGEHEARELLRLRARLAAATGATDTEVAMLQELVARDPLDGDALLRLGQHHARTGDPQQAIFCFERAASSEAVGADARVLHAQVLASQRRYAEAVPLLKAAQAMKPRDSVATFLQQVERAQGR